MSKNIAVIIGGPSSEHDISILTGLQSARILSKDNKITILYWSKENNWYLLDPNLESKDFLENTKLMKKPLELRINGDSGFYFKKKKLNFDVFLNSCHGGPGEDGTLQSLLNILKVKYTGPKIISAQICMDKYVFYTTMKENGLPVIHKNLVNPDEKPSFDGPYILKPRFGGSSIGVEVVNDYETVLKIVESSDLYTEGAIVERYLEDSEDILIGVKNYPNFSVSEIEKPIKNETLFSYSKKYLENGGLEGSERELPAQINDDKKNKIIKYVEKINSIIPTRGIFRYDFLIDNDEIYINEIINDFQSRGAVNILIKEEEFTTLSGIPALKIYGTLDYPKKGKNKRVRCNYMTHLFDFDKGGINLTLLYEKEDRYGPAIEKRVMESFELIKEL